MIDLDRLRSRHEEYACLPAVRPAAEGGAALFTHQRCRLRILGLRLVIDCDKCRAFDTETDRRPDLLVLRTRRGAHEWLVTEIKNVMDSTAGPQVQAGINVVARSPMFAEASDVDMAGLFAFRKANRTADTNRLRGALTFAGRPIAASVARCGSHEV